MKKKKTGTTKKLSLKGRTTARKKSAAKRKADQFAYKKSAAAKGKSKTIPKKKK